MNRIENMKNYLKPYLLERAHIKIDELKECQNDSLISTVKMLLKIAVNEQKEHPNWNPSYLVLLHLMTGVVIESHEFEIVIADQRMYLDELQIVDFWKADFVFDDEEEKKYIKKEL